MMKVNSIPGVNLADDAQRYVGRLFENTYQAKRELAGPRSGFVLAQRNGDERAVNGGGFLLNGYLRRYINPSNGAKENVFYGNSIQKVLYNSENQPVGAVVFNKTTDGQHLDAVVLAPGENDEIMRVASDGTKSIYRSPGSFSDEFSMRSIGTISGHDRSGSPIYNFG